MNAATGYWDRGVDAVPHVTGAHLVLDAKDFYGICTELGIRLPLESALDVGCGTGRVARHVKRYRGVDIAPSAVEYCTRDGLDVTLSEGAHDLPRDTYAWVLCLSVFTHISPEERREYLAEFALRAPELLVDIIPGDGKGGVALWTSRPKWFERAVEEAGYQIVGTADRAAPGTGNPHRYYRARLP